MRKNIRNMFFLKVVGRLCAGAKPPSWKVQGQQQRNVHWDYMRSCFSNSNSWKTAKRRFGIRCLLHVHASLTTANKYSREGTNQCRSKLNLHRSTKAKFFCKSFTCRMNAGETTRIVGGSRNCPTVDHLVFAKDCCRETTLHMFIPCFHRWPWTKAAETHLQTFTGSPALHVPQIGPEMNRKTILMHFLSHEKTICGCRCWTPS